MKYRTIIEVTTEANNPYEAADVAGEYLRGALETGITMKCHTNPILLSNKKIAVLASAILFLSLFIASSVLFNNQTGNTRFASMDITSHDIDAAMQPPLRTATYTKLSEKFRAIWSLKRKEFILKKLPAAK